PSVRADSGPSRISTSTTPRSPARRRSCAAWSRSESARRLRDADRRAGGSVDDEFQRVIASRGSHERLGNVEGGRKNVSQPRPGPATGVLYLVATPIGNLEDMSARALRVLAEVSAVASGDTRRTRRLLDHFGLSMPVVSLFEHNERGRVPELVERLCRGESLALVTDAGSPGVADPGYRLVRAAIEAGALVQSVPGPSAVIA